MKIYSRVQFIMGLLCGLCAIHAWKNFDGSQSYIWIGFFIYLMLKCMIAAFSKSKDNNEETKS